jgi:hypothetical protein
VPTPIRTSPATAADASRAAVFDGVADGCQLDTVAFADRAYPRRTRVDADTDRDPGTSGVGVTGRVEQGSSGLHRPDRVPVPCEERNEHRYDLVTDELVDEAIVVEHDSRSDVVEPVQNRMELGRRDSLGQGRRSANVREQERAVDFGAAVMTRHEREARIADVRALVRGPLPDQSHQRRAGAAKRGRAHPASRAAWQAPEQPARHALATRTVSQELSPEFVARPSRR